MRPRRIAVENASAEGLQTSEAFRFNAATANVAVENVSHRAMPALTVAGGFNAATAIRRGERSRWPMHWTGVKELQCGHGECRRGELLLLASAHSTMRLLQCGHGDVAVENAVAGRSSGDVAASLQCGHGECRRGEPELASGGVTLLT